MALYLTEAQIGALITMDDSIAILEEMFAARARGEIVNRPRVRVPIEAGTYNVMPAAWVARGVVGHKSYTASAKGASFHIVLYAADGSGLLAVMAGGRLSGLRTGAVTGLAARVLSATPGGPIAVIGAGFQATMQVQGLVAATGAAEVRVWSRSADRREPFAARLAEATGAGVRATANLDEALDGAAVVVTITNSPDPVLRAEHVRPGMTVIAAGNNTWLRSEVDPAIAQAAHLVVVDDIDNARVEAGELMRAAELGLFSWDSAVALGDIIGGVRPGRVSPDQIVLCDLQGIGIEDVAVAERVYRLAVERGIGLELPGMKVLLVGGSGLVGTFITPYLRAHHDLRVLDVVPPRRADLVEYVQGSISDPDDVAKALEGMDTFIDLVMRSPQGGDSTDQDLTVIRQNYEVNTLGLHLLLWIAQGMGIKKGIYTSTMSVHYRARTWYSAEEQVPLDSPSAYGLTKGLGELICEYFARWFDMRLIALRITGPRARADYLAERRQPIYPGLYVTDEEDLANAYLASLDRIGEGHGRFDAIWVPGDEHEQVHNTSKAREMLGWSPQSQHHLDE